MSLTSAMVGEAAGGVLTGTAYLSGHGGRRREYTRMFQVDEFCELLVVGTSPPVTVLPEAAVPSVMTFSARGQGLRQDGTEPLAFVPC